MTSVDLGELRSDGGTSVMELSSSSYFFIEVSRHAGQWIGTVTVKFGFGDTQEDFRTSSVYLDICVDTLEHWLGGYFNIAPRGQPALVRVFEGVKLV